MFRKLIKHLFKRQGTEQESADASLPEISWLHPPDNQWGVPVLNVRPVTLGRTSWSTSRLCAENVCSFGGEDGLRFLGGKPAGHQSVRTNLRFRIDRMLADGVLFNPQVMEHKWALYYHRGQILCIRSWTREVMAVAEVQRENDHIEITTIHGTLTGEDEEPAFTVRVLDYLLRSHALDLEYPAPLPTSLDEEPEAAASWCFAWFGNRALLATWHELSCGPPERPLRTDSLLHIAVARGDLSTVKVLLDTGVPIDLLARDGLTPMHWALCRDGTTMLMFLLECGAPVDVRSAEGATPLMNEVQDGSLEGATFLLDNGADPNATDQRGFTALHRAAELGDMELVKLLLERGAAPQPEAQGCTPRSLATKRGKTAIAELLDDL